MSYPNLGAMPVYKKALELREISRAIGSYLSFNKDFIKLCKSNSLRDNILDLLIVDSVSIPEQIALAESSKSYKEQLKSVTFINIMIRNINSYCMGLEKDGVKEKEYLNLLKSEISSFRESFKKWKIDLSLD
jgi:hypothetical protein